MNEKNTGEGRKEKRRRARLGRRMAAKGTAKHRAMMSLANHVCISDRSCIVLSCFAGYPLHIFWLFFSLFVFVPNSIMCFSHSVLLR